MSGSWKVVILALLVTGCVMFWPLQRGLEGKAAPAFEGRSADGARWSLASAEGKVVLIDFWATWCGPCVQTMPQLKAIHAKFKDNPDFVMIGVSLDAQGEDVLRFQRSRSIPWLSLVEAGKTWDNSIAQLYGVRSIPHTVLIGRDGQVVGDDLHGRRLADAISTALGS